MVQTAGAVEARDVTEQVRAVVAGFSGVAWLSCPHTTTALVVNEADDDLLRDLERVASSLLLPLEPFSHARRGNANASAHLAAALFGRECLVRVAHGELALGEHQRLVLLELDGPRRRRVEVHELLPASQGAPT